MTTLSAPTSNTITLDEIMRRPWQALTCQELDALDMADSKQGDSK
jgi:hypothetical protein